MNNPEPGSTPPSQWTLIRGARQLLTLRGPSGPRRGSAMNDLHAIPEGAVLVRDGIIEEAGSTRRLENLASARLAREIDATGKVVMPAFVDPDAPIVLPPPASGDFKEIDIRRMSGRRLEAQATSMTAELASYGVLTVGAHTLFAPDLRHVVRALRIHRALKPRILRLRSIFAPQYPEDDDPAKLDEIRLRWMPAIARTKLAALIEIPVSEATIEQSRALAEAAAANGYAIRIRVSGASTAEVLQLAYSAGAVSLVGPAPAVPALSRALADAGCVNVAVASRIFAGRYTSKRNAIDDGIPVALGSGYRNDVTTSLNPQYMLYLACTLLGMTIEEAIVATTYNAACSLRLSHVTGSLEPGKSADICIMDVNDYRELARHVGHHDVCLVMRAGKTIYRRPNPTFDD
jgi:imidazolonepropionase